MAGMLRRHRGKLIALLVFLAAFPLAHLGVYLFTPIRAPTVSLPDGVGRSYTRIRAGVREVYLEGTPEQIGSAHARLLRDRMLANEAELWGEFSHFVPFAPARALIMDVSRVRYRNVDEGFPEARRREIAAEAEAFQPDPYTSHLPTYHRMVFLHSLYDIALSFEHSPLIGCSAFALGPGATKSGHVLFARAFDFEAGDIFDRDKAIFFVRENGAIPFASVAWPGLVGVMSGMNLEGVAVIVNGARALEPRATGLPVVFSLREVLSRAHTTAEAVDILRGQDVMVSHIVFVADASGKTAVVERAPGAAAYVRTDWRDPDRVGVTNHFEGLLANDPKNLAVREHTTTLARRARLDEMLAAVGPHQATHSSVVGMLRDHQCAGGVTCPLGDRRAIDALIATHGIVADLTERAIWVSAGPHLSGAFVRFDLRDVFAPGHDPDAEAAPQVVPADAILSDGRYEEGRARAGGPMIGGDGKR
jgi:hypothetical protein